MSCSAHSRAHAFSRRTAIITIWDSTRGEARVCRNRRTRSDSPKQRLRRWAPQPGLQFKIRMEFTCACNLRSWSRKKLVEHALCVARGRSLLRFALGLPIANSKRRGRLFFLRMNNDIRWLTRLAVQERLLTREQALQMRAKHGNSVDLMTFAQDMVDSGLI